jgi:carboxypeptidase Taq
MTAATAYELLEARFDRLSRLAGAQAMLHWDMQTIMPRGGAEARGEQLSALDALHHELLTDPRVAEWLASAEASPPEDPWSCANLREMRRVHLHATALDSRLVEALAVAGTRCGQVWQEARPKNDFAAWAGPQAEVFALVREAAQRKAEAMGCAPYDALIDQFEPGMTAARIETLFAPLRARIPALIEAATSRPKPAPGAHAGPFATDAQKALGLKVMRAMGFDFDHGRLDISAHPFCGGTPDDVRMTTRYREDDWLPAFHGIVHETGHGLYEQGLPRRFRHQPVGQARGMGVHESQSLFWEMQIGRSEAFCAWLSPLLSDTLGVSMSPVDLFGRATEASRGLIRVDADEVTYPAHILLRFELEQRLVAGSLEVRDLPEAWRDGMARYLGVVPEDDRHGCMQDIHWTDGAVGYFPSYTLGAMIAAQLATAARAALPGLDEAVGRGELLGLRDWLRDVVHARASLLDTDTLVLEATGRPLAADTYLAHLERRYLARS